MNKKLISTLIAFAFLMQCISHSYFYPASSPVKHVLRPISVVVSVIGIKDELSSIKGGLDRLIQEPTFYVLNYSVEESNHTEIQRHIEKLIAVVYKDEAVQNLPGVWGTILAMLDRVRLEYNIIRNMDNKIQTNYLVSIARRLKKIGAILQRNQIPLTGKSGSSCVEFCHFIQRITLPEELIAKIGANRKNKKHFLDEVLLGNFNKVLQEKYGVSLDEVIIFISNMTEEECMHWANINKPLKKALKESLGSSNFDKLSRFIRYHLNLLSALGHEPQEFCHIRRAIGVGEKNFAYLLHYAAIKTAKERLAKITRIEPVLPRPVSSKISPSADIYPLLIAMIKYLEDHSSRFSQESRKSDEQRGREFDKVLMEGYGVTLTEIVAETRIYVRAKDLIADIDQALKKIEGRVRLNYKFEMLLEHIFDEPIIDLETAIRECLHINRQTRVINAIKAGAYVVQQIGFMSWAKFIDHFARKAAARKRALQSKDLPQAGKIYNLTFQAA